jgi:hypothetical protein
VIVKIVYLQYNYVQKAEGGLERRGADVLCKRYIFKMTQLNSIVHSHVIQIPLNRNQALSVGDKEMEPP